MKSITTFILSIFLLLIPFLGNSAHIIGGTFSYNVVSVSNNFADVEVTLYLYRDANAGGANFDAIIQLGLYKYLNSEYTFEDGHHISLSSITDIEVNNLDDCSSEMIQYELGTYTSQITIPLSDYEHFTLAYQRCCRDNTISNISDPEETGIAISFDLFPAAFTVINSPANENNDFPIITKVGTAVTVDMAVEDEYAKEYFLTTPKSSGGVLGSSVAGDPNDCEGITPSPKNCLPEFDTVEYLDPTQPYGLGAEINLDLLSGEMNIEIPAISKVLIGLTVDRFIDGVLSSKIRQQFVINASECNPTGISEIENSDFNIWPSPTSNKIYFESQLNDIKLLDHTGKKITINSIHNSISELDLIHLTKGVYIIKGTTEEGRTISQKVIKMD